MAANLFKLRYLPNPDGSESGTALTDSNTVFVHTYLGDDNTGDGTRAKPYRSIAKANLKSSTYLVFRGVVNEYLSTSKVLVGDDINQQLITTNYGTGMVDSAFNLTTTTYFKNNYNRESSRIIIKNIMNTTGNDLGNHDKFNFLFLGGFNAYVAAFIICMRNCTACGVTSTFAHYNGIILTNLNAVPGSSFAYIVMPSSTVFKYNGVNIIQPLWTNDSKANIALLRTALINAGMSNANVQALFQQDSFGNETCLVINETRAGGNKVPIFNQYANTLTGTLTAAITVNQAKTSIQLNVTDSSKFSTTGDIFIPNSDGSGSEVFTYTSVTINSATLITFNGASYTFKVAHNSGVTCTRYGDVLDFTLNPDPSNEALWASNIGGYVGCFRPAESTTISSNNPIINVNDDGTDDTAAGSLMSLNASGNMIFNSNQSQVWNRMRDTTTTVIPLGSTFKGLNAMSQDGSPFGFYLGKKQNLIDNNIVNPGDTLTVGATYKVFNDSSKDTTKAIIYNGVQYLPEYLFTCISGVPTFTLLNDGSGTYVKKLNADVLESIEILPYDDINTPSNTLPKFSAPLMGDCKLLYYTAAGASRYGTVAGNPVLFGDLAGANFVTDFPNCTDKIPYYNNWAISNADQEFFSLSRTDLGSPKNTYFTAAIPVLRYLRREINGHFDQNYDY